MSIINVPNDYANKKMTKIESFFNAIYVHDNPTYVSWLKLQIEHSIVRHTTQLQTTKCIGPLCFIVLHAWPVLQLHAVKDYLS